MALIEIRGLRKYYRMGETDVHALDGVDLDIERGEFVAITGASGSGKSTMMHLLGCLDRPTSGSYRLNGRNVSEMPDRELAAVRNKYIGFVFQTFNLINRTPAVDNVAVPLFYARQSSTRAPARAALERVGLGHRWTHKPSELSGGERQRVAIARAIVNDPVLLLADEPTGNLDSRTGAQIMEIFHSLNAQGVTIILVTHEPDVAAQARRVVHMRDGQIISDRPTEQNRDRQGAATEQNRDRKGAAPAAPTAADHHGAASAAPPRGDDLAREPVGACRNEPAEVSNGPARTPHDYARMPARVPRGATATLVLGVLASLLFAAAVLLFVIVMQRVAALKAAGVEIGPQTPPPVEVGLMWVAGAASALVAIIVGILAIVWSRGVKRRVRSEPGNWTGLGRARLGAIFGWATIVIPVVFIGFQVTAAAMR